MRLVRLACAALAFAGLSTAASNAIRIPRVSRPPTLSDFVNNEPREAETAVTEFWQFTPEDGTPISQGTTAYLSYDDRNLYVAFVCLDDPAKIRARVARRKDIEGDDRVTINIDTFHDHKRAYFFDVNPYGVQMDGITTDGQGDDFSFETLWYTDARILKDRYIVLETIPFRSLRFPEGPNRTWGIFLGRFIQRNNEFSGWPHVSRKGLPQFVGQFGDGQGLEGISPGRNLQVVPYALASRSRFLDEAPGAPPQYRNNREARAGLDAKTVLRDALTLDFTVNPDFSQVESDEPQVTVNQRYEVYFPERRPFFTENAGMFETPETLFFSRRIVDPQFGARITGKVGRWALAALAADDRAPGARLSKDDPLRGDRAIAGVVRVQREFGRQSHIGGLATERSFGGAWNRVASVDTRLVLPGNWSVAGQAVGSFTREAGGARKSGQALRVNIQRESTHFTSATTYIDRSPEFYSGLGYIQRVDIRQLQQNFGYRWRPATRKVLSFGPWCYFMSNWDRTGRIQDWTGNLQFVVEMKRQTSFVIVRQEGFERYQGIGFRKHVTVGSLDTQWLRWLHVNAQYVRGSSVNYYPAAGLRPFGVGFQEAEVHVTLRPRPKLRLDESYYFTRLAGAQTVFNDHVLRSKANYQFTRALSVRAILDYHGVLPNAQFVALERTKRLGADVLFTYLVHPGTALYAGYSSAYENFRVDPLANPVWRRTATPNGLSGRQVFVKLSYMFRY
jgi:hypothetical protein